jgi:hypothetical protein
MPARVGRSLPRCDASLNLPPVLCAGGPDHLDRRCPTRFGSLPTLRRNHYLEALHQNADRLVAYSGSAHLVRAQCGRLEVRGGTEADHADAWDWVRRFLTPTAPRRPGAMKRSTQNEEP